MSSFSSDFQTFIEQWEESWKYDAQYRVFLMNFEVFHQVLM